MNSKIAVSSLATFLGVLAAILALRLFFPEPSPSHPVAEVSIPKRTPDTPNPISTQTASHRKPPIQVNEFGDKERIAGRENTEKGIQPYLVNRTGRRPHPSRDVAKIESSESDEAFLKRIASLPLERANLETRLEVERRIKTNEKDRAKLILSEIREGKHIIAYAVKQPSMREIHEMQKPYQMLRNLQSDPASQDYVDQRHQVLISSFGLTDGNYRLLYAIVPESAGSSVNQYSYAATSEQECMDILKQELAPRSPMVIGVPVQTRQGQMSFSRGIIPGQWRMDHLVSEDMLKPFYNEYNKSNK
ncbi:MAG: hypothetical protein EOP04_12750 [Proteobacteria bacterium]|nr:MAG: hypothetical protein EOP04_12750 [Pseudomonadota bacterium]